MMCKMTNVMNAMEGHIDVVGEDEVNKENNKIDALNVREISMERRTQCFIIDENKQILLNPFHLFY